MEEKTKPEERKLSSRGKTVLVSGFQLKSGKKCLSANPKNG
jgi:hypothetical protein